MASAHGVGLTKTAGEAALNMFIREDWLERSKTGFLGLSERGLLELREYLVEMFNDVEEVEEGSEEVRRLDKIRKCHVCSQILTKVPPPPPLILVFLLGS